MYYSATIIQTTGISTEQSTVIWITAGVSAVNVISTLPGMYLIERMGRRTLTLLSMIGIILALVLLSIGFHLVRTGSPDLMTDGAISSSECSAADILTCTACIDTEGCGFCYREEGDTIIGFCEKVTEDETNGYCNSTYSGDFDFTLLKEQCPSDYGGLIIFALCLYLLCFASGMGPTPWTVNSEIYPLWCRSAAISVATFTNWAANIAVSQTFLTIDSALHQWTFMLYAGLTTFGTILFFIILPETKGKSLEEMEKIFSKPLFKLGRQK